MADIVQCRCDILTGQLRVGVKNLLVRVATGDQSEDIRHHDPSTAATGFAAANMRIDTELLVVY
jgi:hypothetical protein